MKNWVGFLKDFVKKPQLALHVDNKTKESIYLQAFENSAIYAKLDSSLNIIYTNRQFCQIMHTTKQESLGVSFSSIMKDSFLEVQEILKCNQSWEGRGIFITYDKEEIHLNCSFVPIVDEKYGLDEILFLATDVTELVLSKTSLINNLYQDPLTKLQNRLKLFMDKNTILAKYETTNIIFNIDSFDSINDLYGEEYGDEILIQVARWLESNLLTSQTRLYKLEADIYTMVCLEQIEEKALIVYLETLSKKIQIHKFLCSDIEICIAMTIGASQSKENRLKLSQIAYNDAKLSKKSFAIYDKKSNKKEEHLKNIQILKTIENATEKRLVVPYFQPIMSLESGKIEKHEALMRVKNERGEILLPYEFLDITKRSKIYPKLSCLLIQKSIDIFAACPSEFSVNLSFLDVTNEATTKFIFDILEKSGIGPWLIFELLESEGTQNYREAISFIEQVKSYGARIAIDDFGSGYSNFERILELQVDFLKIDGSLIKNIDRNDDMRIITKTIVSFAKELGIKTIAEFVHSEEILNQVKILGMDFAQGYYIGKPDKTLKEIFK